MDENIIDQLKQKNKELIEIVVQKVLKEYPNDIDLIGVCGSFFTNDFHEKSDLDLLVVLNNDKGHGISRCFILDDIGYDIYGSPWQKIESMASYDHTFVAEVIDVDIVYYRNIQCKERFRKLREKALDIINSPLSPKILEKVTKHLDNAFLALGKMMSEEEIGTVKKLSGDVIYHLTNTVCYLNHSYFKLGVKRHLEEIRSMKRVPKHFEEYVNGVIHATSVPAIKEISTQLVKTVKELYDEISDETVEKSVPTKDQLRGTYEEIWSNWYNKIRYAAKHRDVFLAFSSGVNCQDFYDEMHANHGTVQIDLMKHFHPNDLNAFVNAFEEGMQLYKKEYAKVQMQVLEYDSVDAFRKDYLGLDNLTYSNKDLS